jgi:hypothetical protein
MKTFEAITFMEQQQQTTTPDKVDELIELYQSGVAEGVDVKELVDALLDERQRLRAENAALVAEINERIP